MKNAKSKQLNKTFDITNTMYILPNPLTLSKANSGIFHLTVEYRMLYFQLKFNTVINAQHVLFLSFFPTSAMEYYSQLQCYHYRVFLRRRLR